jgi:recombination protein RecA
MPLPYVGEQKANMATAAELRMQIESALAERIPAALSFRPRVMPELLPCGLAAVDAVLGGGLPLGGITELTGAHSSGRTTLVLSALAEVTRRGESCAYVDASDALNPVSAAALGVDLRRLLWVRTGGEAGAASSNSPVPTPVPAMRRESPPEKPSHGGGWRHPRQEAIGMNLAVGELFHGKQQEHVDFTPRCSESIRRERVQPVVFAPIFGQQQVPQEHPRTPRHSSWTRLDQALRATDLLLSAGGFRALVLDLGDVSPEQARRIPLATWYRFRLQVEKSQTLFLVMTQVACANSCATVSLQCRQASVEWQRASERSPSLLAGMRYRVNVARSRAIDPARKKPVAFAGTSLTETIWSSTAQWSR